MTQAALKLRGPWEVRRKLGIPTLSDAGGAAHVEQALNQVTGVKGLALDLDHHLVKVRYETTFPSPPNAFKLVPHGLGGV
jgi:hypothetical protein